MHRVLGFILLINKDGSNASRLPLFDDKDVYLIGGTNCSTCDVTINTSMEGVICKIHMPPEPEFQIWMEVISPVIINSEEVKDKVELKHDDIIVIDHSMMKFTSIHRCLISTPESEQCSYQRLKAHIFFHLKMKSTEEDIVSCLKCLVPKCSNNDIQSLMNQIHAEKTLLTNACALSEKELVFYLVDMCKADINFSDGVKYPALHSAIFGRNIEIIKFLLNHEADVTLVDAKGFKPLFYSYDVEDHHSVEIIQLLARHGANINSAVIEGKGKILQWKDWYQNDGKIENKDGEVIQYVSRHHNYYYGEDEAPLITNALHRNLDIYMCLIELYEPMTKYDLQGSPGILPTKTAADGMDIFGASYAIQSQFHNALLFWENGMDLRFGDKEEKPIYKKNVLTSCSLLDYEQEIQNRADFDEFSRNHNPIRMFTQALLIYQRILPSYTENVFEAFSVLIEEHRRLGHFKKVLELHIELQKVYCTAAHSRICYRLFNECSSSIAKMLNVLKNPSWPLSFEEKMVVCEQSYSFLCSSVEFDKTYNLGVDEEAFTCLNASIRFMMSFLDTANVSEKKLFQTFMQKVVSSDLKSHLGHSILHRATDVEIVTYEDHMSVLNCPDYTNGDVLEMLLKSGSDPNIVDYEGNTVLHYFIEFLHRSEVVDEDYEMIDLLVKYGSHLDSPNKKGKTVIDLMKDCNQLLYSSSLQMRSLQCCAASVIAKHNLQVVDQIPDFLLKFIKLHQVPID